MGGSAENRNSANCVQRDSVDYLECRGILRSTEPPVIKPGGCDICMAQPFLYFCYICLVIKGVCGGRCAQAVSGKAQYLDSRFLRMCENAFVDAVSGNRRAGFAHGLEKCGIRHCAMTR